MGTTKLVDYPSANNPERVTQKMPKLRLRIFLWWKKTMVRATEMDGLASLGPKMHPRYIIARVYNT